jgi:N-acetylglutamate synthase-like GNAT family acetyltransferase
MKEEYVRIIENDPTKKARIITKKISEKEYEIVKFEIPVEYVDGGVGEQLLQEITEDADKEGIALSVDINKIMSEK